MNSRLKGRRLVPMNQCLVCNCLDTALLEAWRGAVFTSAICSALLQVLGTACLCLLASVLASLAMWR
jgi:hypothetical protein